VAGGVGRRKGVGGSKCQVRRHFTKEY